ncbi:MAG: UDP-N-acetylglucosamine 1-carboxyvinyltransferase [Propionibacteriaceae bacterium]|jgi:UDP-N-acetylglucosamine 1-carboxyvinyltransferase|nr:UDP-N-acetylglucosamine 1-carboxyvinyltransferase [Propionibacteriaceae bacterium]
MSSSAQTIGQLVRNTRLTRGMTQTELARALNTSQSAIGRIEAGNQNLSLEMVNRISEVLGKQLISPGSGQVGFTIDGGGQLHGSIETRTSKNAAVSTLCAALLNRGRTTLRGIARIEEVNRLVEVLVSIGVDCQWSDDGANLSIQPPSDLDLPAMNTQAARRTRSVLMFLGPLMHLFPHFSLPYAGGCDLGTRTVEPHLEALRHLGLSVKATDGYYHCTVELPKDPRRQFTLTERGDTVTENAIMAAALTPGVTTIRNASPNYMVQDLCDFIDKMGVTIEGIGTTTLVIHGQNDIMIDIDYDISEDPIESMSLLTAAVTTNSQLTITRVPIEFMEIELAILDSMKLNYSITDEYRSRNGRTRLVDLTVYPSQLVAAVDKIHPMPFPGLNIDNLPFFAVIAASAQGNTTIFDWVYDNRMIHMMDLNKLGAHLSLLDPHRIMVAGPTQWRGGGTIACPPALRPAMCLFLAALGARGQTVLKDAYVITRGYEDLPTRLNALGAHIRTSD